MAVLFLVLIGGPIKHTLNHTSNVYDVFSISGTLKEINNLDWKCFNAHRFQVC